MESGQADLAKPMLKKKIMMMSNNGEKGIRISSTEYLILKWKPIEKLNFSYYLKFYSNKLSLYLQKSLIPAIN